MDLTPGRRESLVRYAQEKNVSFIDIFDMERLRHILDSPEGLLVRLQYLDIPMSATEQAALIGKFGNQLQNAVTARFDRVERTLSQMERFLTFQKAILRLDVYIELTQQATSAIIGDEAVLLRIGGLRHYHENFLCLCVNQMEDRSAGETM